MTSVRNDNNATYRPYMGAARAGARGVRESHSIAFFTDLTGEQASAIRGEMMNDQDQIAQEPKVRADIVRLVMQDIA